MLAQPSSARAIAADRSSFSPGNWLSTISYRSRATSPLSDSDLDDLVRAARIRNRAESITGMVIYDDGQFLQWLEGPADNLSRIVESISRDRRHTDIEILGQQSTPVRLFDGWDLRLARKQEIQTATPQPSQLASDVLRRLDAEQASPVLAPSDFQALRTTDLRLQAQELARLLLTDDAGASDFMKRVTSKVTSPGVVFRDVFEPAARALGDAWADDDCTEFDVTIGLVQLQTEMRRLNCCAARSPQTSPKRVLVVPLPGEPHMLSAVLNAEMLWQAGWNVSCEFPETDGALQALVAGSHFDALNVSLSPAMSRKHRLHDLAATISSARLASRSSKLAIVASGRIFSKDEKLDADIGTDASSSSSSAIEAAIVQALDRRDRIGGSSRVLS